MMKRPDKKRAKRNSRKAAARKKSGTAKPQTSANVTAKKARRPKPVEAKSKPANWAEYADIFADHLIKSAHTNSDLSVRLTRFLLDDFSNIVNNPQLNDPVPSEISANPNNLDVTCQRLRSAFQTDASWGVDATKFKLDGGSLVDAISKHKNPTISWLISLIYHYVLAARVAKAA